MYQCFRSVSMCESSSVACEEKKRLITVCFGLSNESIPVSAFWNMRAGQYDVGCVRAFQ